MLILLLNLRKYILKINKKINLIIKESGCLLKKKLRERERERESIYIDYDFGQGHTSPSKGASQSKLERCTTCLVKTVCIEGPAWCGSISGIWWQQQLGENSLQIHKLSSSSSSSFSYLFIFNYKHIWLKMAIIYI